MSWPDPAVIQYKIFLSTVKYGGRVNQTGQYGQRTWRQESNCVSRGQQRNAGRSRLVTDGHAETSRCVCLCVCVCFIGFYANFSKNTKLVSKIFAFSCYYKGTLLWRTFLHSSHALKTTGMRNHNAWLHTIPCQIMVRLTAKVKTLTWAKI